MYSIAPTRQLGSIPHQVTSKTLNLKHGASGAAEADWHRKRSPLEASSSNGYLARTARILINRTSNARTRIIGHLNPVCMASLGPAMAVAGLGLGGRHRMPKSRFMVAVVRNIYAHGVMHARGNRYHRSSASFHLRNCVPKVSMHAK